MVLLFGKSKKEIGKERKNLIRDIRRYINQLNEAKISLTDFFEKSTYIDAKGERSK